jgi:hypothetical protein
VPNGKQATFDLLRREIPAMVAWREPGESQCEWHQIEEFAVSSLHVVLISHAFCPCVVLNQPGLPGRRPMYCLMIASAAPVGLAVSLVEDPELPLGASDSFAPVLSGSGNETSIAEAAAGAGAVAGAGAETGAIMPGLG